MYSIIIISERLLIFSDNAMLVMQRFNSVCVCVFSDSDDNAIDVIDVHVKDLHNTL